MSITDELREWKGRINTRLTPEMVLALRSELNCIADRIDREHRMAMEKVAAEVDALPMTDESMAEHGWVRLPLDADGVPIRVGDVVEDADVREIVERVRQIRYTLATSGKAPTVLTSIITDASQLPQKPSSYLHHHTSTVEDVLREFAERYLDYEGMPSAGRRGVGEALMDEYAAKLRLAGDGE